MRYRTLAQRRDAEQEHEVDPYQNEADRGCDRLFLTCVESAVWALAVAHTQFVNSGRRFLNGVRLSASLAGPATPFAGRGTCALPIHISAELRDQLRHLK